MGADVCTSIRSAEVLQSDGTWLSVGRYEHLRVGDVFRGREPDGSCDEERCVVVGAPQKLPSREHPDGGFCWSVEVEILEPAGVTRGEPG